MTKRKALPETSVSRLLHALRFGLSVEELDTMCFDYYRDGVYLSFSEEMSADARRHHLIEYVNSRKLNAELREHILEINPNAFRHWEDAYD